MTDGPREMEIVDLEQHDCVRAESWMALDGRGIPLTRVCTECKDTKLAKYRPEILEYYTQADVDEPIEAEEEIY